VPFGQLRRDRFPVHLEQRLDRGHVDARVVQDRQQRHRRAAHLHAPVVALRIVPRAARQFRQAPIRAFVVVLDGQGHFPAERLIPPVVTEVVPQRPVSHGRPGAQRPVRSLEGIPRVVRVLHPGKRLFLHAVPREIGVLLVAGQLVQHPEPGHVGHAPHRIRRQGLAVRTVELLAQSFEDGLPLGRLHLFAQLRHVRLAEEQARMLAGFHRHEALDLLGPRSPRPASDLLGRVRGRRHQHGAHQQEPGSYAGDHGMASIS
jgi:hypothetical protein